MIIKKNDAKVQVDSVAAPIYLLSAFAVAYIIFNTFICIMLYHKIIFKIITPEIQDIAIAMLQDIDALTGVEQDEHALTAYFNEDGFDISIIRPIAEKTGSDYEYEKIAEKNWNAAWESHFEPVAVSDFCYIRADFHPAGTTFEHEIIITPKMSFGTGHHATTQMMITGMRSIDFRDKKTLDFGTGTGVLAILAEKLGSSDIIAIDNDSWSYENAKENCERNGTGKITVLSGGLEIVPLQTFDIVLANINRHILLEYMPAIAGRLLTDGILLLSGILANEDVDIIAQSAADNGLSNMNILIQDKWAGMRFRKQ